MMERLQAYGLQLPDSMSQRSLPLPPGPGDETSERPDGAPSAQLLHSMGHDPVSLDALQARCGWGTAQLQGKLLELELMGQVGRLPGGLFQRMGSA